MSPEVTAANRGDGLERLAVLAVVVAYCTLEVWLWSTHVPWRDEAQAWLRATTLSHPLDFFIVPGEGHPPLWFWLLRGLSTIMDFNQARLLSLGLAMINAVLLARLLGDRLLLLVVLLFSLTLTQFWGYHFRPYGVVLLCLLSALLLNRNGRPVLATWLMAVACGFHFFSGFLMAIWLFAQWRNGTKLSVLLPPALLALAFGCLAVLSGMGNDEAGPMMPSLLAGTIYNLGWIATADVGRHPLLVLATLGLLTFALRDRPALLVVLLGLLVTFALATAAIYGKYLWHAAFMTMMCLLAFLLAGLNRSRTIVLALMLTPQAVFGLGEFTVRFRHPDTQQPDLVSIATQDAGPGFETAQQLLAWPDFVGLRFAAVNNVRIVNAFDGSLLGPVLWRDRDASGAIATLARQPVPYWLLCQGCDEVLKPLTDAGRTATYLSTSATRDDGETHLYRID